MNPHMSEGHILFVGTNTGTADSCVANVEPRQGL